MEEDVQDEVKSLAFDRYGKILTIRISEIGELGLLMHWWEKHARPGLNNQQFRVFNETLTSCS